MEQDCQVSHQCHNQSPEEGKSVRVKRREKEGESKETTVKAGGGQG